MQVRKYIVAGAAAISVVGIALAAEPVKLVVSYPAGASLDTLARTYADQVRAITNTTMVVENKPGANGMVGAQAVATADPDGKTLLFAPDTLVTVNPLLYTKSKFDLGALQPVGMLAVQSSALVVRIDSKESSVASLLAKAKTADLSYSSAGPGSSGHLVMSYFAAKSGIKPTHIPYKGGAAAALAVVSGEVDAAFLGVGNVLPLIEQGKLKALAITSPKRIGQLPNVPTMTELGYKDFVLRTGNVLMAPKGVNDAVRNGLFVQMKKVADSASFKKSTEKLGMEPAALDRTATLKWLDVERGRWEQVIRENNITTE